MQTIKTTLCVTACTSCISNCPFQIVSKFVHNLFLYSYRVTKEHYCEIFNNLPHIITWTCNSSSKVISLTLVQYIALTHCCLPTHLHTPGNNCKANSIVSLCAIFPPGLFYRRWECADWKKYLINCLEHTVNGRVKKGWETDDIESVLKREGKQRYRNIVGE